MGGYLTTLIFNRILLLLVSLLLLATICFVLLKVIPGSPLVADTDQVLHPLVHEKIMTHYKLDQSLSEQYFHFMGSLLKGQLGLSLQFEGRPSEEIIGDRVGVTIQLGLLALMWIFPFCFIWNYLSYRFPVIGRASAPFAVFLTSMPLLMLAPALIFLLAIKAQWLPLGFLRDPASFVLPVFLIGFKPLLTLYRLLRVNVQQSSRSDFVRTARAKGLPEGQIFLTHILKVSALPLVAMMPTVLTHVLSGSVLVELMFSVNGLGLLLVESLVNRDVGLVVGITLFIGTILVSLQLLADFVMKLSDPRVQL